MASIRERNGSYQITVSCGYDIKGKKLLETTTFTPDPSLTPKKREKVVQEFAQQFETKVKNGLIMNGSKITLQEFLNDGSANTPKSTLPLERSQNIKRSSTQKFCLSWAI